MSLLIQGNKSFRQKDYLAALMSYQSYQDNNPEISKVLNIQSNLDLCLDQLGIKSCNRPLVSVIVPVYNVENYIERCLRSILSQTLTHIELIVIDDGSSDRSCEIIHEIAKSDSRVVTIFNNVSSGNSGSPRNQGLHYANGEYICFVDADDYIDSTMLEDLYLKGKLEDADIVTSSGFYRETFGVEDTETVYLENIDYNPSLNTNRDYLLKTPQFPIIWFRIYRNSFLRNNKIFLGEYRISADVIFSLKCLLLANKIVQVNNIYYHYNFDRPGSTIERRKGEQVLDLFKSYEKIVSFIKDNNFESYMGLVVNKFIGDFFYCKKNLDERFVGIFEDFSKVFVKKNLHSGVQRDFISEYSNKTLDELYSSYTHAMSIAYNNFLNYSNDDVFVSVIMPIHNLEQYLEQSINSILRQKLKNIELILIDDGSQDGSNSVISKFITDSRVVLTSINRPSGTPATPRNIGLVKARGRYIAFVDGDDWIEGEFLSRLYSAAQNKEVDVIYARAFHREEGAETKKFSIKTPDFAGKQITDNMRIQLINTSFFSNIWNRLYRKDFLKNNQIYFPKMYVSEDLSFSLICTAFLQSMALADTQGYHYRYSRPNSTTELRMGVLALRQIYAHNHFLQYLDNFNLTDNFKKYALVKKINSYYYTWSRISDSKIKEFFRIQILNIIKDNELDRSMFGDIEYKNYLNMLDSN